MRAAAEYSNRDRDADDVENDDPRMGMGGGEGGLPSNSRFPNDFHRRDFHHHVHLIAL